MPREKSRLIPRLGQERTLFLSLAGAAACGMAYALSPSMLFALVLILPLSGLHTSVLAGSTSLLQHRAPPPVRGRVLAIYLSLTMLGYAFSSDIQAELADRVGLRTVLFTGASVLLLWTFAMGLSRRSGSVAATTT